MTTTPVIRARLALATEDRVTVAVDGPAGSRLLEYAGEGPVWAAPPPTLDFAAVALVQYAASEGCDLHLEGPVTSAQLERLDEYQTIWSVWKPERFRRIRLSADEEVAAPDLPGRGGAVMGFSGGVDSCFALLAHQEGWMGRLGRRIDLGVLVVGWDLEHGDASALARAREAARRSLEAYGVELAVVSTNWQQEFCNAWFLSFTGGLAGILHTFAGSHSAAVHATDFSYREELQMPPYGSHVAVNHLLGSPSMPVISTGGTHRRIERVAALTEHPALLEGLRVCFQDDAAGSNCGRCEKCVRTQLELRAVRAPTGPSFDSALSAEALRGTKLTNPVVLRHYEGILDRLDPDDDLHDPLQQWVRDQRLRRSPAVRRLTERVEELEAQLQEVEARLATVHGSRSWRLSRRVAAAAHRLRGLARRDVEEVAR